MFGLDEICLDQILAMKEQEETSYKCDDYLQVHSPWPSQAFSGKVPLHLQHAAFEECAQFINMLSIDLSSSSNEQEKAYKNNNTSLQIPTLAEIEDVSPQSSKKNKSPSSVFEMLSESIPTFDWIHQEQDLNSCSQNDLTYQLNVRHLVLWRTEMSKWSFRVVNAYGFSRTTVAIAFSNLDRYICTIPQGHRSSISRRDFVLMTITSLYIAIKTFEAKRKLSIVALQEMSRYAYTLENIRQMESDILDALQWKVNPPVAQSYLIPLVQLVKKRLIEATPYGRESGLMDPYQQRCILHDSSNLLQISLSDCAFVSKRPSSIAIAAILISWLESQFRHIEDDKPDVSTQTYCNEMKDLLGIDMDCDEVEFAYNRLIKFYGK